MNVRRTAPRRAFGRTVVGGVLLAGLIAGCGGERPQVRADAPPASKAATEAPPPPSASAPPADRAASMDSYVATAEVKVDREQVRIGAPLEITYRFRVANDARAIDGNYWVMMHFVGTRGELMWTDDHEPPVPTSRWKPNGTVEYRRTFFIPNYPYTGPAMLQIGLYSPATQKRLSLNNDQAGQRAYNVGLLQIRAQSTYLFKDGWYGVEKADGNAFVEWRWTRKRATIAFRNPKRDCLLHLEVDNPSAEFKGAQRVQVLAGSDPVDEFALAKAGTIRTIRLPAARLGSEDAAEVHLLVDQTFVPAAIAPGPRRDTRELGIRVLHVFVEPAP